MTRKINKYKTLLEFLEIIAPGENYANLQAAQCDFVVDMVHKAVRHEAFDPSISPEALEFVRTYSSSIYRNLKKFLENLKGTEFLEYKETKSFEALRAEITSFMSLFDEEGCDDDVKKYYKTISSVYAIIK